MELAKMRNVLAAEQKIRNGWIHGPKRYHQDLMFPFPHLHFLALLSSELALPLGQPSLWVAPSQFGFSATSPGGKSLLSPSCSSKSPRIH